MQTGQDLPDQLLYVKFSAVSWLPDNHGFYYTRFPIPGSVPPGDENYFGRVYFHRLGDTQEKDAMVFERPDLKEVTPRTEITRDGRYLIITSSRGERNEIHVLDRRSPGSSPTALFANFEHMYRLVGEKDGRFFFLTDQGAALGRVIAVDFGRGSREVVEIIPPGTEQTSWSTLIRVETKAGHGGGKPVSKQIDEAVDVYTFLISELGQNE